METHEAWQARIQRENENVDQNKQATIEPIFGEPIKAVPVTDSNDSPVRSLHLRYNSFNSYRPVNLVSCMTLYLI